MYLLVAGLLLFLARDVFLLRRLGEAWTGGKAILSYVLVYVAAFLTLGKTAEFVSRSQAISLIADARFWIPAIVLHLLLGWAFLRARNLVESRWSGLVLVPAPVFLYSAGGLCWFGLSTLPASNGTALGAALGAIWVAVVVAASRWKGTTRNGAADSNAVSFAAATNFSAILLLPMHQQAETGAGGAAVSQGVAPFLALLATAGLIAASFVFHRLRGAP